VWQETISTACPNWDGHYAVSDFVASVCAEVLGVRSIRAYLGVDSRLYGLVSALPLCRKSRPVVLLPARLVPEKGALVAVEALRLLVERKISSTRPRMILTSPMETVDFYRESAIFKKVVEKRISECGLSEDVQLLEGYGCDDMVRIYQVASVVIHPSTYEEPMGLAPLEAMCAARPVVTTCVGGMAEGVGSDGEFGFLMSEADPHDLAELMSRVLGDPERARSMGLRGRLHVRRNFDMRSIHLPFMSGEYLRWLAVRGD
jgi:glycosyltransferase involved in cell wall biosynthesis